MKKQLENLLIDIPYSIRHEGGIEELIQYIKEQDKRVEELEKKINDTEDEWNLDASILTIKYGGVRQRMIILEEENARLKKENKVLRENERWYTNIPQMSVEQADEIARERLKNRQYLEALTEIRDLIDSTPYREYTTNKIRYMIFNMASSAIRKAGEK